MLRQGENRKNVKNVRFVKLTGRTTLSSRFIKNTLSDSFSLCGLSPVVCRLLGSLGDVNANSGRSQGRLALPAGFFCNSNLWCNAEQIFPTVVLLLRLCRPAYRVSALSFSCLLKHPGRYKRRRLRHVCSLSPRHIRWWTAAQILTPFPIYPHISLCILRLLFPLPDMMSPTNPRNSRNSTPNDRLRCF